MKELPYLLMIMELWTGDWEEKLYHINTNVYEDNGRGGTKENG